MEKFLVCLLLLCPLRVSAGILADNVKRMVVFIYSADATGEADKRKPLGTGFLITVPVRGTPNPMAGEANVQGVMLLITARHILDPAWAYCSTPQRDLVYLRVNTKGYEPLKDDSDGVAYVPLPLAKNGKPLYEVSDDSRIDAAVIEVGSVLVSSDRYDVRPMRLSVFASSGEIGNLKIGDSIFSAGLVPGKSGEKRNYPFFKFGNISNIPGESTWVGCAAERPELRLERVWFIAANLVEGNSGSPIFFWRTLPDEEITRGALIGVQSSAIGGADIAGMTPIEDVFKIIERHMPPGLDLFRGDETKRK